MSPMQLGAGSWVRFPVCRPAYLPPEVLGRAYSLQLFAGGDDDDDENGVKKFLLVAKSVACSNERLVDSRVTRGANRHAAGPRL